MQAAQGLVGTGAAAAILLLFPAPSLAQEPEWPFHGFLQANWSIRTTGVGGGEELLSDDFLLGEERLELELQGFSSSGRSAGFQLKADFFHDAIADRTDLELREAYLDLGLGPIGYRLGRQIVTWGVGDLLFINDVFPKDYAAFFSGRPLQYLKVGVDGVRVDWTSEVASGEIVVMPSFEPDRIPRPDRFVLPDPFEGLPRVETRPRLRLSNTEAAARLYRRMGEAEVAIYAFRGFHRSPALRPEGQPPERVVAHFPRLGVYGASAQRAGLGGVLSAEVGYYDSREDRGGTDPWVPNSELRFLLGYQRQLERESDLGLQYYAEWMQDHGAYRAALPPGAAPRDEMRHVATLRYTREFAYRTWRLSFFAFIGLSEADYLAIPEIRHNFTEELWLALGANLFGGGAEDLFGALDANDNVYVTARYGF